MNKKRSLVVFLLVSSLLFIQFASAQSFYGIEYGVQSAVRFLFGDVSGYSEFTYGEILFVKFLVFILIFMLISVVLKKTPQFGDKSAVVIIISLVVSILAVRYMTTTALINFIWLPYGTLGVLVSALLPFIIGFYFIEQFDNPLIRKVGWSAFLVIFAGLAIMRWDSFSDAGGFNLAWLYVLIAILSFLLLLFDKNLRVWMAMSSMKGIEDVRKREQIARITNEIEDLRAQLARTTDPRSIEAFQKSIKAKKRLIKEIMRS